MCADLVARSDDYFILGGDRQTPHKHRSESRPAWELFLICEVLDGVWTFSRSEKDLPMHFTPVRHRGTCTCSIMRLFLFFSYFFCPREARAQPLSPLKK